MTADTELDALLALDGASFEMASGYLVEFMVRRTDVTDERPHGLSYALVFRPVGGEPIVRFDNAHAVPRPGGRHVKAPTRYDHWHRTSGDRGRPYAYSTPTQLLQDFWDEVKRVLDERGIPNDL